MIKEAISLVEECDNKLKEIEVQQIQIIQKAEQSIRLLKSYNTKIKALTTNYDFFEEEKNEIFFFKQVKPRIISKLIYWAYIISIETKRPVDSDKEEKKFLKKAIKDIRKYWNQNHEFYHYYRSQTTFLDHIFFVRGNDHISVLDIQTLIEPEYFYADQYYCTTHDLKVAKIMANDLFAIYLKTEITKIDNRSSKSNFNMLHRNQLCWTENKISLVELIYALHTQGSFNKGTLEIKDITSAFEKLFNVELGDIYRSYMEIKARQNQTKFIDELKTKLIHKIRIEDNKKSDL